MTFPIISDVGEFSKSFKCIYPEELELKQEHSETHKNVLDLGNKFENGIIDYKIFHKRDNFSFFIVRMPYFQRNNPSTIFYCSIFFRIARWTDETGIFCIESIGTLFKNAIESVTSKLHQ